MIKKTRIIVPAISEETTEFFCEICGRNLKTETNYEGYSPHLDQTWKAKLYSRHVDQWDEGDITNAKQIDICFNCMETKVIPLIEKEFNIKARVIYSGCGGPIEELDE